MYSIQLMKFLEVCRTFKCMTFTALISYCVWLFSLPWNIALTFIRRGFEGLYLPFTKVILNELMRWIVSNVVACIDALSGLQQQGRKMFEEVIMSNTNMLTSFDCETRIVFLKRLLQNKQQEIEAQKCLNGSLVKMLVQNDPELGNKLERGFGHVEAKLARLEEILKNKTKVIEKKVETSTERVEEKLTDLKKQIAMLGLAAVRSHKETPTDSTRASLADSFAVRNESQDSLHSNESTNTDLRTEKNDNNASAAATHSSRYTNISWLLMLIIKFLLCFAMFLFTIAAVLHSQTCWKGVDETYNDSFTSKAIAFLRTELLRLLESVAWLTNKMTY